MSYSSPHINTMLTAARQAGKKLVRDFGEVENLQVSVKGVSDFVSAADIQSEKILINELCRAYPDYDILAEEAGEIKNSKNDNPLKNAPHTASHIASDDWTHAYSRNEAAYPANHLKNHKYWPPVARIDNAFGDRNLMCTCPPASEYNE